MHHVRGDLPMSIDLTPEHSWKMTMRHYHSFRGEFSRYEGIRAVVEYFGAAELTKRLFARTSHYTLIVSPRREYYIVRNTVRIEECDDNLTFSHFDSVCNEYVIIGQTNASDVVEMCEKCVELIAPSK